MRGAIWRHAAIRPHPAGQPGSGSHRAGCGARWRPGAAPQGSRPRCQPRGARMGRRQSRLHQGQPRGMQGAKGPSRDRSREGRRRQPGHPEPARPLGQCRGCGGWWPGETRRRTNPPPMPDQPLMSPTVRGPVGRVACRRESAVILRRQRAPPGRFTIGEGLGFHKAAPPCLQPCCEKAGGPDRPKSAHRYDLLSVTEAGQRLFASPGGGFRIGSGRNAGGRGTDDEA